MGSEQLLDQFGQSVENQAKIREQIQLKEKRIDELKEKRTPIPPRIKLAHMPEEKRYNMLKTESQLLINAIKMICYRAETTLANLLEPAFKRTDREKRMLIKRIIQSPADITPDLEKNTLTVTLHGLSTPRFNKAVASILETLNQSNTIFLKLTSK